MDIKNCPKCGRIFSPVNGQVICRECMKKDEEEFSLIRDYLKENIGADLNTASEETGVSRKKILKYLREGRLEISDGMSDFLKCEKCGVSIRTGQFCKECAVKISKSMHAVLTNESAERKSSGSRMYLNRK